MIDFNNLNKVHLRPLRAEFNILVERGTAGQAMQKLLDEYVFKSVLDVGAGEGLHSNIFSAHGKEVTAVDLGGSIYAKRASPDLKMISGNFIDLSFDRTFDCIWCSHVLEHQLNVNQFLLKINSSLAEGGVLAITVPPMKNEIVGGHVSLWNAGLLIYNLVMAGFDCRRAAILRYSYNISCIIEKRSFILPKNLNFDCGDIEKLSMYFPPELAEGFNGDIYELNWYK
ncbi:class I SAM-dependent methyltransferase [Aeromonas schubertii]|uniref:class I SAM-dependent methyltransferase n=1 Tax=Aeromonas schubertii TaxID=652 RepID=UPI0009E80A63|nr:class I SAM-dependent methyltransferase [Aeromonas schubertii]